MLTTPACTQKASQRDEWSSRCKESLTNVIPHVSATLAIPIANSRCAGSLFLDMSANAFT
eukprot:m.75436 g.75436  ORF g.75436 m.75436 type:complete len:60 (+) comp14406_c0_seq3:657-836(+)